MYGSQSHGEIVQHEGVLIEKRVSAKGPKGYDIETCRNNEASTSTSFFTPHGDINAYALTHPPTLPRFILFTLITTSEKAAVGSGQTTLWKGFGAARSRPGLGSSNAGGGYTTGRKRSGRGSQLYQ